MMTSTEMETATVAGGCFWCMEAVFRRLRGVTKVTPGYAGGTTVNPTYQDVSSGGTGHAEAIEIVFDPSVIPYGTLLDIFFHLHDPTTRDRQGNDVGTQYRSVVFYHSDSQKHSAEAAKKAIDESHAYAAPAVTEIIPFTAFYPAEEYHRGYYEKNSYQPYCQYVIDPKISKLLSQYATLTKEGVSR